MRISRLTFVLSAVTVAALSLSLAAHPSRPRRPPKITVYKTSSPGCCKLWVDHLKANGFDVQAMDVSAADLRAVSKAAGLKEEDTSCRTRRSSELHR